MTPKFMADLDRPRVRGTIAKEVIETEEGDVAGTAAVDGGDVAVRDDQIVPNESHGFDAELALTKQSKFIVD